MIVPLKKLSAMLLFISVLLSVLSTIFRYFDKWALLNKQLSSGIFDDLQIHLFSIYLLSGIFFVSYKNAHIKLDLFSSDYTKFHTILSKLLLFIFSSVIGYYSFLYFNNSIRFGIEQSSQPGGLPVSHLKFFLFISMVGLIFLTINRRHT